MKEYKIEFDQRKEMIDVERMDAQELYQKLSKSFAPLFVPERPVMHTGMETHKSVRRRKSAMPG